MKKEYYLQIKALLEGIREVGPVSMWQNNLINDTDRLQRYPMLFIQFTSVPYLTNAGNQQESNASTFTVHILHKAIDTEDTQIFDISQAVFVALQRAGFRRLQEQSNYFGTEIIDWQITFEAPRFTDDDAVVSKITKAKPPVQIDVQQTPL